MKVIKWLVIIGLSLYIILCAGLYLNQEKLVFLPSPLSDHHQFRDGQEVFVEVEKDINLSCLYLEQADAKGVVLYLHGNKGNNRRCLKQAYQFELNDYSLFMPDYRGFGKSDGYPHSEAQMLKDIQKVYDYIQSELKPKKIIVVGYSLGTGMASYLAANNDVSELFLVAPFTSISDLKDEKNIPVPDFLVKFNFDTYSRLDKINCPITIFHSPIDEIIPYACSQKLKSQKTSIEFYTLPSVSHRATIFNPMISDVFAKKLGRS